MEWIAELTAVTGAFAAELASGDLDAPVPSCPGWTLADLAEHLRKVHLWAAYAVTEGKPDGMPDATTDARPAMAGERLVEGYPAAAAHLIEVLSAAAPDDTAWTFGPEQNAGFWRRRQVHETLVHLYDALLASGRESSWTPTPELAWDGVDEVATLFYPRQVRIGRIEPLATSITLTATDLDQTLTIGDGSAAVGLEAPSADLLLAVWRRVPATDPAVAAVLATAITP